MPSKIDPNNSNTTKDQQKPQIVASDAEKKLGGTKFSKNKVIFSRLKRKILKHVWLVRASIIVAAFLALAAAFVLICRVVQNTQIGFYASLARDFVFAPQSKINTSGDRVNLLILGKGGKGHDAPDLTDSMIFISLSHKASTKPFGIGDTAALTMVSLPRDIWIYDLKAKLNSIYYWGNKKEPKSGGLILTKSVVEEVTGQPIQYAVVIDFSGFEKIINVLGGINVDVKNSFTDNQYPISGKEDDICGGNDPEYKCRYETVVFEKGVQHMDGATALKFVRSRHAEGDEGTDLARAARQEQVINAMKEKVLSKEIYLHPKKLIELKDAVLASIETDVTPQEAAILARWFIEAKGNSRSYVLSENYLEVAPKSATYDNLYVFIPKEIDESNPSGRSWQKVHGWISCLQDQVDCK